MMRFLKFHIILCSLGTFLQAQSSSITSGEPEVRRAIPLTPAAEASSPSALPVTVRAALPVTASPQREADSNIIRVAPALPSNPAQLAEDQLAVANGFYQRHQYELSETEFKKFLAITTPGQPRRDQAFFRLGESLRLLHKELEAQEIYTQLIREISSGEFTAAAAYRLGECYQAKKELARAIEFYKKAKESSADTKVKSAACYQEALCRQEYGEQEQALQLFEEASQVKENNPTYNNALMALATSDEKKGEKEKALAIYQKIITDSQDALVSEALVKAATLCNELGKKQQAQELFQKAADIPQGSSWSALAALGVMKLAYEFKDYKTVLARAHQASLVDIDHNSEARVQSFLLAANAEWQLGNPQKALSLYDQILKEAPGSRTAQEAAFLRLVMLQALKSPTLLSQIEEYLLFVKNPSERAQAELLKAESLFTKGDYASAADAYALFLSHKKTPENPSEEERQADALYKEAWCWNQIAHSQQARDAFSQYITLYPKGAQMVQGLVQLGALKQKLGDLPGAVADYSTLIDNYPKAPERELALQQKALALGQQQNNPGMVETFQQLLKDYPTTAARAQANFWIGWAAFESKKYKEAMAPLENSRKLDSKQFGERAGIRLLLAHYYLEEVTEAVHEAAQLKFSAVPLEVSRWLGLKLFQKNDIIPAGHFLTAVVKSGRKDLQSIEVESALAEILIKQERFSEAQESATKLLDLSLDPVSRAQATLLLAQIQQGLKNYHEAERLSNEALLLQPEGDMNSQARLLVADLQMAQANYDAAARAYMALALLTNDSKITPKALNKAAEAYRRANNPVEAQKAMEELHRRFP